jgi:hypothetical protein
VFDEIIEEEKKKVSPQAQLLIAMKTRMINLKREGRISEVQKDLKYVDIILQMYPHLIYQRGYFEEFRTLL